MKNRGDVKYITLNMSIIIVTHDLESAFKIADYIVMLDNGTIVTQGTIPEIKQSEHSIISEFLYGKTPKPNNP